MCRCVNNVWERKNIERCLAFKANGVGEREDNVYVVCTHSLATTLIVLVYLWKAFTFSLNPWRCVGEVEIVLKSVMKCMTESKEYYSIFMCMCVFMCVCVKKTYREYNLRWVCAGHSYLFSHRYTRLLAMADKNNVIPT